jgi:hypothetical protein
MGSAKRGRAGIPACPGERQAGGMESPVSSHRRPPLFAGTRFRFHPQLVHIATGLLGSLGLFVYVATRLQPTLEWHRDQPQFYWTQDFFRLFWREPGGLVRYAAAALAQCDVHNWSGALVFTILAGGLGTLGCALLKRAGAVALLPAAFAPPLLFLWLRQAFGASALIAGLGVGLAWALALGLSRGTRSGSAGGLLLSWLVAAGVYLGAGFWAWLAFLVAIEAFPWASPRSWLRTGVFWLGSLAAAVGVAWSYGAGLVPGMEGPDPVKRQLLWGALALGVPVLALIRARVVPRFPPAVDGPAKAGSTSLPALSWAGLKSASGRTALVATVLLAVAVAADFDRDARRVSALLVAAAHEDHLQVLEQAGTLPRLPAAAEIVLHRSLYHTGRLLDELFRYENLSLWRLLPGTEAGAAACRAQVPTLLELGQVNEAERLAHEALEFEGPRPDLLRWLAEVNVLKDRPAAARVFLNALSRHPVHRVRAQERLHALMMDPAGTNDARLRLIRQRMVRTDLPHSGMPTALLLEQLLDTDPSNDMAWQYLLAHHLLSCDLERFVRWLRRRQPLPWTQWPRHCEEAVLLYQWLSPDGPAPPNLPIRPETRQRFMAFRTALAQGALQSDEGRRRLAETFRGTYWLYHLSHAPAPGNTTPSAD